MVTLNSIPVSNPFQVRLMLYNGVNAVASIEPEDAQTITKSFDRIVLVPGGGAHAVYTQSTAGNFTISPGYVASFTQAGTTIRMECINPLPPATTTVINFTR
ncbi:MAG: hypothetical protein JO171_13330 [Paludibacterium sp.]|uniref:hypothetical protein n=1 Tax=Paludibacterium sp. TaxID=1917523 RepID=UPI0025F0ABD7|nr:hypothetical protein [Paludibacterium sp.]MBV8048136.1 hypothetical protein [Paludibacterium sp.]MBV8647754.1 hypothetical protein [Paludibacterium sp.]